MELFSIHGAQKTTLESFAYTTEQNDPVVRVWFRVLGICPVFIRSLMKIRPQRTKSGIKRRWRIMSLPMVQLSRHQKEKERVSQSQRSPRRRCPVARFVVANPSRCSFNTRVVDATESLLPGSCCMQTYSGKHSVHSVTRCHW